MRLKSKNLNKVSVITLFYVEIILQVVFRIWFYIPALHWEGNNVCARDDLIKSGINLHSIPTHKLLPKALFVMHWF